MSDGKPSIFDHLSEEEFLNQSREPRQISISLPQRSYSVSVNPSSSHPSFPSPPPNQDATSFPSPCFSFPLPPSSIPAKMLESIVVKKYKNEDFKERSLSSIGLNPILLLNPPSIPPFSIVPPLSSIPSPSSSPPPPRSSKCLATSYLNTSPLPHAPDNYAAPNPLPSSPPSSFPLPTVQPSPSSLLISSPPAHPILDPAASIVSPSAQANSLNIASNQEKKKILASSVFGNSMNIKPEKSKLDLIDEEVYQNLSHLLNFPPAAPFLPKSKALAPPSYVIEFLEESKQLRFGDSYRQETPTCYCVNKFYFLPTY